MVEILDYRGQPLRKQELSEPQTARVGMLQQEFAAHPSRGLTPARLARILEEAERGEIRAQCDLFEDMEEKDGHILAEMGKRKRALHGLQWDIVTPRNATAAEEQAADFAREVILDMPDFEDLLLDMMDAAGKGFACSELEWELRDGEWLPREIAFRPQRWFLIPREARDEIRLRNNTPEGEALQPFGWIVHVHKAKSGDVSRGGLHRNLAWPYLFKNYSVRDLAEFLEIYGLPLRLGTYPSGANDKEKSTLLQAVVNIGHAAAGIVPEGMMIEFKEAAKGGKDPFEFMIDWCERIQSKAILGGTLTSQTDSGSGAYALGNVHNEVRWDLCVSDARQVASTLTRDLVYPLIALNRAGIDSLSRSPRFVFDTRQPEDLKLYADSLPSLVDIGLRIPESWAQDKLGIPAPDDEERILARMPTVIAPARARLAALRGGNPPQDVADAFAERLEGEAQAALDGLIDPVRELVMRATSLEEIRDGVLELYRMQDITELGTTLQKAFAAADLAGRFEVSEGK